MSPTTMKAMAKANGKVRRLSDAELAAMTRPARITDPAERRSAVRRATSGLRVGVRVTRSLYRPR
jgi:hypothetical protein